MGSIYRHTAEQVWVDSIVLAVGIMTATKPDVVGDMLAEPFLDADKIRQYLGIEEGLTPERIVRVNHALDSVRLILDLPLR